MSSHSCHTLTGIDLLRREFLRRAGKGVAAATLAPGTCLAEQTRAELCKSVRPLGPQFLDNQLRITGQDGATSSLLPNGDTLWLFGDTIEGPFQSIRHHELTDVLSNTGAIVPLQSLSQGIRQFEHLTTEDGRRARQLIEFAIDEDPARHRLWPIHSVCVGNEVFAFYHKITMDPKRDVFETFELDGMGIARANLGEYHFERLRAPDGSFMFWKGDQPTFGVYSELLPDGYLYLWGSFWTGMFLARTQPGQLTDLASYEYLVAAPTTSQSQTQPRWSRECRELAALFDHVPNEMSAAYNPHLQQHLALHVYDRDNRLAMRTAPQITGPWSPAEIFHRPERADNEELFTACKEHPEFRQQNGQVIYVTYVSSGDYIPRLLEVQLN